MDKDFDKFKTVANIFKPQNNEENFDEGNIKVDKNGAVTFPSVTLGNPSEALRLLEERKKTVLNMVSESDEYVVNEVREMLELLFNSWEGRKLEEWHVDTPYETSKGHHYENYEAYQRGYYVEEPIEFLKNYEGKLSKFMDKLDEKLKNDWIIQLYNPKYVSVKTQNRLNELRRGKSVNELNLEDLKDVSFVDVFKEEIQNLSKMPESIESNSLRSGYLGYIIGICEDLGYNKG